VNAALSHVARQEVMRELFAQRLQSSQRRDREGVESAVNYRQNQRDKESCRQAGGLPTQTHSQEAGRPHRTWHSCLQFRSNPKSEPVQSTSLSKHVHIASASFRGHKEKKIEKL
jgi:hypothetical protein